MKILENYDLKNLNTFGISAFARLFVEIETEQALQDLFENPLFKKNEKLFLGSGSNVLFTKDFDGVVILNKLKGIEILEAPTPEGAGVPTESVGKDYVLIKSMSGEIWHDLVLFAVNRGLWGIENLSLIPGTVGAAPIQNIGAYGTELKDTLVSLEAYDIQNGEKKIFKNKECEFSYRDSIFKNKLKGKYFISAITLKLSKLPNPNISYNLLQVYLAKNNISEQSLKNISDAVSAIRRSKLPDPKEIGNAGSFFKNILLKKEEAQNFLAKYPDAPIFEEEDGIKIPAGWLIEQCGWKGKRIGNVGVHERQALVLVNYGGAKGQEVKNLADQITASVFEKFGLNLVPEVNLI